MTEAQPSPVQLTIAVPAGDEAAELLAAVVWGGAGGAAPAPDGVEERRERRSGGQVGDQLDRHAARLTALAALSAELVRCGATIIATDVVAADEGLDAWREHARVWRAGPFAVRPPWLEALPDDGAIDLVIDPGATFGSGSHQSTRMALELLATCPLEGAVVTDVGSGWEILGIGAALLGATRVDLVELDARGKDVGLTNAMRNRVADRVRWAGSDVRASAARAGDEPTGQPTAAPRVVMANMLIGELEAVAPSLRMLAGVGGIVIAAGLLTSQVPRLLASVGAHRSVDSRLERSETDPSVSWAALTLELEAEGAR